MKTKNNPVGRPKKNPMSGVQKLKKSNYKGNKSKFSFESQLKIIEEAKLTKNNTQVGRKYGISETCVRFWRKKEAEIRKKILMKPDDSQTAVKEIILENSGDVSFGQTIDRN